MRISGPISLTVYYLANGTKLFLFGDNHGGRGNDCKSCVPAECMTIANFVKSITPPCDFFLESDWFSAERKQKNDLVNSLQSLKSENFILNTMKEFAKEMYQNHKPNQPLRVHHVDIRNNLFPYHPPNRSIQRSVQKYFTRYSSR
jgi:hypothetical protein